MLYLLLAEAASSSGDGGMIAIIAAVVVAVLGGGGYLATRGGGGTDTLERPPADERVEPQVEEPIGRAPTPTVEPEVEPAPAPAPEVEPEPAPELTLGERFRARLTRTSNVLGTRVAELFGGGVDEDTWEGLEEALITADVGVTATMEIVEELRRAAREDGVTEPEDLLARLKQQLRDALGTADRSLGRATEGPTVWLVTGVNGAGKTTTIGKLAMVEQREGRTAVLAAADTFRAAAAEQLELWGERTGQPVVRDAEGTDPASVAYEGYHAAVEQGAQTLIIDTAGRLHNKRELMDELGKVKRVVEKQAGEIDEVLLVLDGTTGQNGIAQAQAFTDAVDVSGIVLTKLDGSSRGGIVVAVQRELGIPVKYVGLGEDVEDLAPFDPDLFVEGLFADVGV